MSWISLLMPYGLLASLLFFSPGVRCQDPVQKYIVQVKVYVDPKAVEAWKVAPGNTDVNVLKDEIYAMFVDTQDIYDSLIPIINMDIDFEVSSIKFINKTVYPFLADSTRAIILLQEWLEPANYHKNPYDVSILFSGVPMARGTLGVANIGAVCTANSAGIILLTGTYRDVIVLAHELGHVLGANHDMEQKKTDNCYHDNGKVMNQYTKKHGRINQFTFSECTGSYLRATIERLNREKKNCLADGGSRVSGKKFGHLVTADQLCQRKFLHKSFAHLKEYNGRFSGDHFCVHLHCLDTHDHVAGIHKYWKKKMRTPQGFACGHNRECVLGRCVEIANSHPYVTDSCPLGDQLKYTVHNQGFYIDKCEEVHPADCTPARYEVACCHMCDPNNVIFKHTGDQVCQSYYGAGAQLDRSYYHVYGDRLCDKLHCLTGDRLSGLKRHNRKTPDGLACGKNKRCYKGKCVKASRNGNPNISDSCPSGDQDFVALKYPNLCVKSKCKNYRKQCCATCPS